MATLNANVPKKYEFLLEDLKLLNQEDFFIKVRSYVLESIFSSKSFNQFGLVVEIRSICKANKCKISFLKRRGYTTILFDSLAN